MNLGKRSRPLSRKWEALLASLWFASFFLPWIYSLGAPIAAHQIRERLTGPHRLISAFTSDSRLSQIYHLAIWLYIIPVFALILLVLLFIRRYQGWMGILSGAITVVAFIFLKGEIEKFPFHRIAPGAYLALGTGMGLALTPLFRLK